MKNQICSLLVCLFAITQGHATHVVHGAGIHSHSITESETEVHVVHAAVPQTIVATDTETEVHVVQDLSHLTPIECSIVQIDRAKVHPKEDFAASQMGKVGSSNWCGYVSAPMFNQKADGTVSYVSGTWTVPKLVATKDSTYCAIWVGMDGFLGTSVEQIGTSHNWENGVQQNYAWFEMYPHGAYQINGFPDEKGDQISAHVLYAGSDTFKMTITNHTKAVTTAIPVNYTKSTTAQRSSAEWVVEAPYSGSILELADFGVTSIKDCKTTINGVTGTINNSHWANDAITMTANKIIKAQASKLSADGSSFNVAWDHE
jgi:hypothetical protein